MISAGHIDEEIIKYAHCRFGGQKNLQIFVAT